ncbi:hypothetical protein FGIG_12393 [Fasciola gigantica]|uniref:Uncharacterized protein n=1 Tax=Fasciola gigantica TaxID=46835 RepID=A0A504Z291_FASGI|nr:hypothetical protein FGIG_12393 [Fasciola gigantica]
MGMFFAEYLPKKSSLTVTINLPKEYGDANLSVKPKSLELKTGLGLYSIELPNILMSCITCRNLENHDADSFSCTFTACETRPSRSPSCLLESMESILVNGDSLLCKFCSNKFVEIKGIKSFKLRPPVFTQEETSLGLEASYFCHSQNSSEKYYNSNVQLVKESSQSSVFSVTSALHTGTEVALHTSSMERESYTIKSQNVIYCSRCWLCVGRKVSIGSDDLCSLWTNCLNVLTEERDIDGDFLRFVEKPL